MHPFCCVSDHSPSTPSFSMYAATPETPFGSARSQPVITRSVSQRYNHPGQSNHHHLLHSLSFNHQNVLALPAAAREPPVDVKINDIAGNSIAGILYKWVNYGKGWRPRWFVLQDGVLSYYKIKGPDKIVVIHETEKGSRVIGEESTRMISRNKRHAATNNTNHQLRRKPFGEVHLKV